MTKDRYAAAANRSQVADAGRGPRPEDAMRCLRRTPDAERARARSARETTPRLPTGTAPPPSARERRARNAGHPLRHRTKRKREAAAAFVEQTLSTRAEVEHKRANNRRYRERKRTKPRPARNCKSSPRVPASDAAAMRGRTLTPSSKTGTTSGAPDPPTRPRLRLRRRAATLLGDERHPGSPA